MENEAFAREIFLALLCREPLPAQRFTDLETRIDQLILLAKRTAERWDEPVANPKNLKAEAKRAWDYRAQEVPEVQVPRKLQGAGESDLFVS